MQLASYISIGLAPRPYLIYFSYKNLKNSLVTLLLYFTFQNSLFQWIVRNKSHTFSLQNLLRGNKIPINSPTIGACTGRISVVPFLSFGQSCLWTKLVHSISKEGNVVGSISSFPSSTTITDTFKTLDVYCYWIYALLFDEQQCYSLLMDKVMLLYTMVVLTSGGTISMMLLLLHQDHQSHHLIKTLMTLKMAILEQCLYCYFQILF